MYEWQRQIQMVVDEIDNCIKNHDDEALTLCALAKRLGYSEFHTTRKFKEISGMRLKDYLRYRKMAFALKEVRDSDRGMIEIACDYGFSSHEAFTRAFKTMYGIAPSVYRKHPSPVVLRTKINPFDRYFFGLGEIGMMKSADDVKIYLGTVNKLILTIGFDFIIPFSQLFIRKKIDLGKFLIRYFSSSLINIVVYNTIDF